MDKKKYNRLHQTKASHSTYMPSSYASTAYMTPSIHTRGTDIPRKVYFAHLPF